MLLNALHLSFYYLDYSGELFNYPALLGVQLPFPLLQGVLLYFYVSHVTDQAPKEKWKLLLHLIPAILAYCYLVFFFIRPGEEKIQIFQQKGGEEYGVFMAILLGCVFLSGVIYVIWCSILLRKHKKIIRSQFSDIEEISLSWLKFLVYGLGLVWILVIVIQEDFIIYQAVAIFVILIGFFGVQQKNIFNKGTESLKAQPTTNSETEQNAETKKEKYQSSGLSKDQAEEHFQKLNQLMNEGQFYKNPSLSLGELAAELDLHPNYISQIINNNGGKSFYDYVNNFRVNEFKHLISQPENKNFTLMALAYDCGFNSKSSFNRYFKKITGVTPSQYTKK